MSRENINEGLDAAQTVLASEKIELKKRLKRCNNAVKTYRDCIEEEYEQSEHALNVKRRSAIISRVVAMLIVAVITLVVIFVFHWGSIIGYIAFAVGSLVFLLIPLSLDSTVRGRASDPQTRVKETFIRKFSSL